jgi:hypothetical protein
MGLGRAESQIIHWGGCYSYLEEVGDGLTAGATWKKSRGRRES